MNTRNKKIYSSMMAAVMMAGCISGTGFAAEVSDSAKDQVVDVEVNIVNLVMDSAQNEIEENLEKFDDLIVTDYEPYVTIYSAEDEESEVEGLLYPGSYGEILEEGEEWTQIVSGEVTGYIQNEYVSFDEEAMALAEEVSDDVVRIEADSLNIRENPGCDSEIISYGTMDEIFLLAPEGSVYDTESDAICWTTEDAEDTNEVLTSDELFVTVEDEEGESWYRIYLGNTDYGYVSAQYVTVEEFLSEAVPVETEEEESDGTTQEEIDEETEDTSTEETQEETEIKTQEETEIETQEETEAETQEETEAETEAETEETEAESTSSSSSSVSASSDDAYLLACLVYAEAGNQSYEGQLAVANVVLNRVKSSSFPNTISDVIYQSGQFGPATNGSLSSALSSGPSSSCIQAANAAIAGSNNIGSQLYFGTYTPSGASSVVTIGAHSFYNY